ncbi:UvrD-helicase domain-containing protein [Mycobacterium leprae]|uniref:UvrD-helicase domain-containing protein n=1 Tax=Mycobacterium leprae TaxID=1769 RepID=UPI0003199763
MLIDDAQQLNLQAARLVLVLAARTERVLIACDPNQAVFSFRSGEPARLLSDNLLQPGAASRSVTLTGSHRCAPAAVRAVNSIVCRLPGGVGVRQIDGPGVENGSVTV